MSLFFGVSIFNLSFLYPFFLILFFLNSASSHSMKVGNSLAFCAILTGVPLPIVLSGVAALHSANALIDEMYADDKQTSHKTQPKPSSVASEENNASRERPGSAFDLTQKPFAAGYILHPVIPVAENVLMTLGDIFDKCKNYTGYSRNS